MADTIKTEFWGKVIQRLFKGMGFPVPLKHNEVKRLKDSQVKTLARTYNNLARAHRAPDEAKALAIYHINYIVPALRYRGIHPSDLK